MTWTTYVSDIASCLEDLAVTNNSGRVLGRDDAFALWVDRTTSLKATGRTVFLIGNGASASMASHMACDLAKSALVRTEVFFDLAMLTALGNDIGFEDVFAHPIAFRMSREDMLVAVSSSGESPNIIKGVEAARKTHGFVVTISAMGETNRLRGSGDLNWYVPARTYGLAETCHAALLHYWMDMMAATVPR